MYCLDVIATHYAETEKLIDPTQQEMNAIIHGGRNGGEYLESIGKTDLAALSADEWTQFLLCVIGGYTEHFKNEAPF